MQGCIPVPGATMQTQPQGRRTPQRPTSHAREYVHSTEQRGSLEVLEAGAGVVWAATWRRGWPLLIHRRHPGVVGDAVVGLLIEAAAAVWRVWRGWRHRVYELGHHHKVTAQHQDGACVTCRAAVVGGAEERDQVALRKALKAVHDALVRAHNHLEVVALQQGHTWAKTG